MFWHFNIFTWDPFVNFNQWSSCMEKKITQRKECPKKTHSSRLSINIAIHVQVSRHICRHFHSFSIQVPERTTLGLGSKEMTLTPKMPGSTWSQCPGWDTTSRSTASSRRREFQSRWRSSRTSPGSTCRQPWGESWSLCSADSFTWIPWVRASSSLVSIVSVPPWTPRMALQHGKWKPTSWSFRNRAHPLYTHSGSSGWPGFKVWSKKTGS